MIAPRQVISKAQIQNPKCNSMVDTPEYETTTSFLACRGLQGYRASYWFSLAIAAASWMSFVSLGGTGTEISGSMPCS